MKGGNRKHTSLGIHHIYQRAQDRGIIFYTVIDRLIYLSILSVKAREYSIRVLAIAIMYSHIHQSCSAEKKTQLYKYVQDSSSIFARMYNHHYGPKGSLFSRPFGSSLKRSEKEIRSNLAYVNNNHTEKGLCPSALQARWNLLCYRNKSLSELKAIPISETLSKAYQRVKRYSTKHKYLKYKTLLPLFKELDIEEKERLIDFIILSYPLVDFESAERHFGGFDKMLLAFDSNTGGEYDIREEYSSAPDTAYKEMAVLAEKNALTGVEKPPLFRFPEEKRRRMIQAFYEKTSAKKFQILKFLHLPDEPEKLTTVGKSPHSSCN